ncbi:hypothetical protein BJ912DRAFT_974134, partial [Pholiota molesta]
MRRLIGKEGQPMASAMPQTQQKMFWVSSAPLRFEKTFHIVDEKQVWYEDMSGSGAETIAHLRENGRITLLFCGFEGPPRIVRLFGTGTVHEFDTPGYNALIPLDKRQPGSRAVIVIDIHKVGTSCGYAIPFYDFKTYRMKLHGMAARKESEDVKAESSAASGKGLKWYWKNHNAKSIDGLPAVSTAFNSTAILMKALLRLSSETKQQHANTTLVDLRLIIGFLLGILVSGLWINVIGNVALNPKS